MMKIEAAQRSRVNVSRVKILPGRLSWIEVANSTERNRAQSSLLRLPGQLRDEVYKSVFDSASIKAYGHCGYPHGGGDDRIGYVHFVPNPFLPCRQIYHGSKAFLR